MPEKTLAEEPQQDAGETDKPQMKKENPALSDFSLMTLGRVLKDKEKYTLAMQLGIPNAAIIRIKAEAEEQGQLESMLGSQFLLDWKQRNVAAKDREKLVLLENGFRRLTKDEVADVVRDAGNTEQEINAEMLKGLM
jgi:hypothetical protein